MLIADGRELRARLEPALSATGEERTTRLADSIRPYLQLVEDKADEHTGIQLGEIWRYFRYTWSLPTINIPGRQLFYLVRDAGHPLHAVMGIAALSNCAMQMRERDNFLGWTCDAFVDRVETALRSENSRAELAHLFAILEHHIEGALGDISATGLATKQETENPTPEIVSRLRRQSYEFAEDRKEALEELAGEVDQPLTMEETEVGPYGVPPIAEEVLVLEKKAHDQPKFHKARSLMVAKKRAFELARLLGARVRLREIKDAFLDPERILSVLHLDETRIAITTAWLAAKTRRVGTNLLELTTCGAIPPYNHLLGGKLTALLLLSPQVNADYRARYGSEPSIIGSLLKNQPLIRDSTLVYLGTTSLYALGSSQYERLRLPAGIIAPDQQELRFQRIGYTSGYGTVQFTPETVKSVDRVLAKELGYREVNSIFGEGPSPRLRKLRTGLKLLGFDPENLLRHNQHRLIYGVPLCAQARDFLRGETSEIPDYLTCPENYRDATGRIAEFWRRRWLASRLNHLPALEALLREPAWKLSDRISVTAAPAAAKKSESASTPAEITVNTAPDPEVDFWRSLAHAGPNVCSDELAANELERLHVQRPVEDFLVEKVRDGFSVVLTGNAGDGKTHLLRRLLARLESEGIKTESIPDATAIPGGGLAAVLDVWRKARATKRPFLLAANEYPLYQLRREGVAQAPDLANVLAEVNRQCSARLAYGAPDAGEAANERVLVVDLSLRNPLHPDFAGALLDRLLGSRALQQHAASGAEPNFARNFARLSQPRVRDRLLILLRRLIVRGERAPVRELWIWLARLLFSASPTADGVPGAPAALYSERFFDTDDRFRIAQLLAAHADPAWCSHPQWDDQLEHPGTTAPGDWLDSKEPAFALGELDAYRFACLKRLFYFEHARGEEAFALDDQHALLFAQTLADAEAAADSLLRKSILYGINLCYCPKPFRGIEERLHLWVGHRYHELPTRSYVANQSIPLSDFEIVVPRLPTRLRGALEYQPDHFLLRHRAANDRTVSLRVDYPLFATLSHLKSGLPRHLLPDRDINRLDNFLEQLQTLGVQQEREFVAFNTEHRLATRIRLSSDGTRYIEVKPYE
jgi:hypothetical protein